MRKSHTAVLGTALGAAMAMPAQATDLVVKLELPAVASGNYEKPYVAVFLEKSDDTYVRSLLLWHKNKTKRGAAQDGGAPSDRYLNELREWWRASGGGAQESLDAITAATRGPGTHELVFSSGKAPLGNLPAGKYQLIVEVAREVKGPRGAGMGSEQAGQQRSEGGRAANKHAVEAVRVDFDWPVTKATTVSTNGKTELGAVSLTLKP